MTVLSSILESAWAERIGWTLVHSVWQIALVMALFAIGTLALRRSSANARYVLGCLALLAMVAWPAETLITMSLENLEQPPSTATVATLPAMSTTAAADAVTFEAAPLPGLDAAPQPSFEVSTHDWAAGWENVVGVARRGLRRLEPALPWAAVSWVVGASLLALRPLRGLIVVRRLKSHGLAPLSTELRKLAGQLMMRLRVHAAVQIAESALIEVPTVVGYFRPMVLLPASAVTGLSTAQLEMIVAHELAHIRRHDYLVNLLQTVIEALLFYHPGVWWVSSQVRREREHCCDDVAMNVCGNRSEYVRALYTLESRRQATAPALAASGGSLVQRVQRIVRGPHRTNRDDRAAAWLAGLIILAVVTSILALGRTYAKEPSDVGSRREESDERIATAEAIVPAAEPATLHGRILLAGSRPEPRKLEERQVPSEMADIGEDGGIANVVVWLREAKVPIAHDERAEPAYLRAVDGRFEPPVLVFRNSGPLTFVNNLNEIVNFHWRAALNPRNLSIIPGNQVKLNIKRPEPVPAKLTSNLRPRMSAYILPLAHPYFAVTGRDGRFSIEDLPPGMWEFGVWHARAGWVKSDRFETGRFKWTIRGGENSVGDLWVEPATLDMSSNRRAEEPKAETPKRAIRPTPLPPLPTLDEIADRSLIDRKIDEAFDELEERGEGHVIVGRVLVEGDDDPTLVNAQMEILGGGYFAGTTRDLHRPVGFVMHGYEPYLLSLAGKRGAIVDVGTIQLKRLPSEKLVPIVGRIELEDGGDLGSIEVQLWADVPAVNTPSNGTSPRPRWPDPIEVELDAAGRFYATGFSPTEYDMSVVAPGFVKHWQRVHLRDTDIGNLGTIKLERPRWVEIDYVTTQQQPISLEEVKHIRLEGGSRWQITPHQYRWDLEFKQRNGQLRFFSSYGPSHLADLGEGKLTDFTEIEAATAQNPPMLVPLVDNHVYLFRRPDWENNSEDLVLFKLRTNSVLVELPKPLPARPAPRSDTKPDQSLPKPTKSTIVPGQETQLDRLDAEGFSQLHRAASGGHVDQVRMLLDLGANVNIEQGTYRGTPLQYAAFRGHGETVQVLLDRGAKVDARDTNGRTPLVWAAMGGHADVAERLLDAGADINAANAGGWTPLRYAIDRGHESLAVVLIDRGANARASNSQGKMPGDLNPELAARIPDLVVSSPPLLDERPQESLGIATIESRGETTDVSVDEPQREPTAVVATILGRDITAAEIEPPPQWYAERQKRIEAGGGRESDVPEAYRARQLAGLISGALFDAYRKQEKLEPTEEQIEEFLKHYQLAKVRSQQERARELEQLRDEAADLDARLQSGDLSVQEAARSSKRLEDVRSQIATIEKASERHGILEDREKQDRFFAEWQVQRWNLQASLFRRYGGRAVWQQAGNEALDAMRDYLREQERDGKFTIHDPALREQFWKIYAPEKLLFEIRDPDRVFKHPWSAFDEPDDQL
jgi:beta-lactamase regulating signal transducer with metallopeptidase domain